MLRMVLDMMDEWISREGNEAPWLQRIWNSDSRSVHPKESLVGACGGWARRRAAGVLYGD